MKSTGIIRRIDDLGRIAIPKVVRNQVLGEDTDSMPMEIFIDGNDIVLRKYNGSEVFARKTESK